MTPYWSVVVLAIACTSSRAPATVASSASKASSPPPSAPIEHRFTNNWGNGLGCTPKGEALTLSGTIVVRPFGKGTDGALLRTDAGDWVVSYRAEAVLLALRDKRVVARGRACDKQGGSIAGDHLDLETLTEAPRT